MTKVLIVGGAGYIGSITNKQLKDSGFDTVIFDSLENGHRWAIEGTPLIQGNLLNKEEIKSALEKEKPDAIVHFAAYIEAGESMKEPAKYFRNNVVGSLNLLDSMIETNIKNIVFSSTAAVYGTPDTTPITEYFPKKPENTYGETKLTVEKMLYWFNVAHNLNYIALRYFNACGAHPEIGEAHQPESHIIPIFLNRIIQGQDFTIFGDDYNTPDGTCIRDYIHVLDLASAHIKALDALIAQQQDKINTAYNVGTGKGYSNKEIAETIIKVTNTQNTYSIGPRRPGDPDILIADSTKIQKALGWSPKHSNLEEIITSAYNWHRQKTPTQD